MSSRIPDGTRTPSRIPLLYANVIHKYNIPSVMTPFPFLKDTFYHYSWRTFPHRARSSTHIQMHVSTPLNLVRQHTLYHPDTPFVSFLAPAYTINSTSCKSVYFSLWISKRKCCNEVEKIMSCINWTTVLLLLILLTLQPWVCLGLFNSSTPLFSILCLHPPTSNLHPL